LPERSLSGERALYLREFQRSLSTVTNAVLRAEAVSADGLVVSAGIPAGVRIRAQRGTHLFIQLEEEVEFAASVGIWSSVRVGYRYQLQAGDAHEILAFHWHPQGQKSNSPHLHISSGAGSLIPELQRAHIPTGEVSLEDVLAFVIRDFNVRPHRTDYARVLGPEV
jgi:hypothetical protein